MGRKKQKPILSGVPAWALSLITALVSPFLLVVMGGISSILAPNGTSSKLIEILFLSIYPILIAVACFFICKRHPESVWYTPIICNALLIFPVFLDPNFWKLSFWTAEYWTGPPSLWIFHTAFLLAVIGAIAGAAVGKRTKPNG
ncbi:hypothetical protein SLH46_16980 [Draconibacterium sp. IB214405]|uniref:hypothetical protein n=1 Tax=Draconibacterium sp. IB214405 TaxID=3097352 RepID=UPI002A14394B|nr:hypothetical protein [Draconibacterium sp. IB214405]MDX8340895.1 hypothetical protein [Draconibacterium sp. IB214405]